MNKYRVLADSIRKWYPVMDDIARKHNEMHLKVLDELAIQEQEKIEMEKYKDLLQTEVLNRITVKVADEVTPKIKDIIENINSMGVK